MKKNTFTVLVEKDEKKGIFVAKISELPGFRVEAKTMDELLESVRKNIMMYLQIEKPDEKIFESFDLLSTHKEAKA